MKLGRLTHMFAAMLAASIPAFAQDDLPPVGHSRFDQLIGSAPVPYPFSRFVNTINRQMQADAGGLPPLRITLIPLGRSLQRNAGAPDFFRFPRVVAAADGNNVAGFEPLKDRLFLGFHEKGQVIEVISYNDTAGRFEFQIVRDYAAGKTPQVFYARRSLCLACHQNAAPMFARPLWDETPANPEIARRLRETRHDFYGIKLSGTDIAYFIDAAADRANLFSVWQTLWQQGCGAGASGDHCRMEAFAAALDYARNRTLPAPTSLPTLDRNWKTQWPHGLPIPNPDLPNRDPLAALADPASDPLLLRPPLETWKTPDKTAFIVGLAGMLDPARVKRLGSRDLSSAMDHLRARGELGSHPFNQSLMDTLLAELGLPRKTDSSRLPPARVESRPALGSSRASFRHHCGDCHDSTANEPPNFLHGSEMTVNTQLDHCAERIFYRLIMAKTVPAQRGKPPMPPPAMLAARGLDATAWAHSTDLAALLQDMQQRLRAQGTLPEGLLTRPYAELRVCLPPSHPERASHVPPI